jgi:hypothetical protein
VEVDIDETLRSYYYDFDFFGKELPDGEWDDVNEAVDLECADEEEPEMFEHLGKEIPGKKFSIIVIEKPFKFFVKTVL